MAKAFEVAAKLNYCESSGSEHSPAETMMDLSDLVNSFIEDGDGVVVDNDFGMSINDECFSDGIDNDIEEAKESLKRLFGSANGDHMRQKLVLDVDKVWRRASKDNSSPQELSQSKRILMARLRDKGHDAGTVSTTVSFLNFVLLIHVTNNYRKQIEISI